MVLKFHSTLLLSFAALLTSCSVGGLGAFRPKTKFTNPNQPKVEQLTDDQALGVAAIGATGSGGGFAASFTGDELAELEKSIVWAPENPNEAFELGKKGNSSSEYDTWTKNYRKAIAEARRTGKPLLIWFNDSKRSYISRKLSNELFSRPSFDKWVREKYTTLVVDKSIDEAKLDKYRVVRLKNYYEKMTERFSVKGTPEVLVVDVKGEVHARYRGYTSGEAEFYWGRLKIAHETASKAYGSWREGLERKGYRMWHSLSGEATVFAKMTKFTDGKVTLTTPEGKRYTEPVLKFSIQDQDWVKTKTES